MKHRRALSFTNSKNKNLQSKDKIMPDLGFWIAEAIILLINCDLKITEHQLRSEENKNSTKC